MMKEKLISFTRSKKNVKVANIIHWLIWIVWAIVVLFFYTEVSAIGALILDAIIIINIVCNDVIITLSEEKTEVIRNNKIVSVLLTNPDTIGFPILIISIIFATIVFKSIPATNPINGIIFLLGTVAVVLYMFFISFISIIISNYFRKKLK